MTLSLPIRRAIAATLLGVTVASAIYFSLPPMWKNARLALALRSLSWSRRREEIFGPYYPAIRTLRQKLPPRAAIALILGGADDLGAGIFTNYYLHPRNVVIYWSLHNYEHNVVEGVQGRPRPDIIVWIDSKHSPYPRIATAEEIRRATEAVK